MTNIMLWDKERKRTHCRGRVTKKNEMFCEWECQNPKILTIFCNISKNQNFLTMFFGEIAIWSFFFIKLHVTEGLKLLKEVYERVAGIKNHTKKCCLP